MTLMLKSRAAIGKAFLLWRRHFDNEGHRHTPTEDTASIDTIAFFAADDRQIEHFVVALSDFVRYHETAQLRHAFLAILENVRDRPFTMLGGLPVVRKADASGQRRRCRRGPRRQSRTLTRLNKILDALRLADAKCQRTQMQTRRLTYGLVVHFNIVVVTLVYIIIVIIEIFHAHRFLSETAVHLRFFLKA